MGLLLFGHCVPLGTIRAPEATGTSANPSLGTSKCPWYKWLLQTLFLILPLLGTGLTEPCLVAQSPIQHQLVHSKIIDEGIFSRAILLTSDQRTKRSLNIQIR